MISIMNEKGKGALQTILIIIILFFIAYLMIKFFPTIHKSYKFEEYVKNEARSARSRVGYEEIMTNRILEKAEELGVNVPRSNIRIDLRPGHVNIKVNYTMEVVTPFYTFKRHFDIEHANPLF